MTEITAIPKKRVIQQFITQWNSIRTNRIIHLTTYLSLGFAAVSLIFIAIYWTKLPPQIPLWYSKPWGTERLASTYFLFLLPGSCIIFTLLNMILITSLTLDNLIYSQILSVGSVVISLLSMITLIKIVLLVI